GFVAHVDLDSAGACVAQDVGQCLLDDPVGGKIDGGGQRPGAAVDGELGLHPCRPNRVQQRIQLLQAPSWGSRLVWGGVGAQDGQDGLDVGQSLVADLL